MCEVAMKLYSRIPDSVHHLVKTLISISSQALSFDNQIRNSTLQLLKIIIQMDDECSTILNYEDDERKSAKDSTNGLTCNSIEGSSLVSQICLIVCDKRNLDNVRDSALECLLQLLQHKSDILTEENVLTKESLAKILFVSKKCMEEKCSTLKATALDVIAELYKMMPLDSLETLSNVYPDTSTRGIDFCDLFSDQERLRMVTIAADLWTSIEDRELADKMKFFVLSTQQYDTFWEARLRTTNFWKSVKEKCLKLDNKMDQHRYLEENCFFTGIILGLLDYEETVKVEYRKMVMEDELISNQCSELKDSTNGLTSNSIPAEKDDTALGKSNPVDDEPTEIEGILESNDIVLMKMLGKRNPTQSEESEPKKIHNLSYEEFTKSLSKIKLPEKNLTKDPMDVLNSIMDDILQSSSEDNLIDLIDCY